MSESVLYRARKIHTLDPNRPKADHVLVREGRILAVGDAEIAAPWGAARLDTRYADAVLLPGFVEGHSHMMTGAMWVYTYVGDRDRVDPHGRVWPGLPTIEAVIAGLKTALASLPVDQALIGWGFDPIFLTTDRLNYRHLDQISTDRPIVVMHSNFHLMTVNSVVLKMVGYDQNNEVEGIARFSDGAPNGELQEIAAMFPVMRRLGIDFRALARTESAMRGFAKTATRVGVTTATDLFSELPDEDLDALLAVTGEADFALRIVPALNGITQTAQQVITRVAELRSRSTDRLRLGAVKLMADGSIQGYTARLKWPGYVTGHPNGIWNMPPKQLQNQIIALHAAGIQMHIHVNGDEASEVVLDGLEEALTLHPRSDHRHTLQHCQMADAAQFRRMAVLGVCVNLFANHIWFFGDQHYSLTMGPDRAQRIDACRTALDENVTLAIHSDSPVTPLDPLHVAWCAVNRRTPSGRVLGRAQRLSVDEALHAITLGPAYTLRLDHEIGSIEVGKQADFAVLAEDPFLVPPEKLKDIPVLGTMVSGLPFQPN